MHQIPLKHRFLRTRRGGIAVLFTARSFARRLILAFCALCFAALPATLWAANFDLGSGARVELPLQSMRDLRDQNLVRQQFDYSCGAAALATILRYGFGDDVEERDILLQLFDLQTEEETNESIREGFSLLDLQTVAQARGYRAEGFRIAPEDLNALSGPVIVYIEPRDYRHFAVLRGISGDRVFLADPSLGNVRIPFHAFLDSWLQEGGTGIIFAVEPATGLSEESTPLTLSVDGIVQPEIMSARELLAVGSPFVWSPELWR